MRALNRLSNQVQHSTQYVLKLLASWNGYLVLYVSKKIGYIPDWAEQYLKLTCKFQGAICKFKGKNNDELPEFVAKIQSESKMALSMLVQDLNFEKYLEVTRPKDHCVDQNNLLRRESLEKKEVSVPKCKYHWYKNLGVLMNVYTRTDDPCVKKLIGFLAYNYLGKAAPICPRDISVDHATKIKLYDLFQLSLLEPGISYNRECPMFDTDFRDGIVEVLATGSGNQFFLTDTKNIEEVLPLWFHTMGASEHANEVELVQKWASTISQKINEHCKKYQERSFAEFFDSSLLVDLTSLLGQDIYTFGNAEKNGDFEKKLRLSESWLENAIDIAVQPYCNTEGSRKKLKALVITNMTCICRCEVKEVGVLKVLPVFYDTKYLMCEEDERHLLGIKQESSHKLSRALLDIKLSKSKATMEDFLNATGIRLGSVKGRIRAFDFMTLEQFLANAYGIAVEYTGEGKNGLYFEKPLDLTCTRLFKRLESIFDPVNLSEVSFVETKPYLHILGKSTLSLLKGLLTEIKEEKWVEINRHPDLRQIAQSTLFKIHIHLAEAERYMHDFSKFCETIELIHYEMAALLTIFIPFDYEDFPGIYKSCLLEVIPEELADYVKIGLTKSAMNTFAGISTALRKNIENPVRIFDPGSHFEIVQSIGESYCFDKVLKNKEILQVDLYVGEFNHNVKLLSTHKEYTPGDLIKEVTTLLEAKPHTKHLTVAVDSTIDFVSSPKAKAVLQHFSEDIRVGKLNFVFFRSGQKFDMFGMDNYYGSPWYMINNGASHWNTFDVLTSDEVFKTDFLTNQWFCLVNKYAPKEVDEYRKAIFDNAKEVLKHVPEILLPEGNPKIRICTVAEGMEPGFIDIKCFGDHSERIAHSLERYIYKLFTEKNLKIHSRGGYGYINPNVNLFIGGLERDSDVRYTTMRLHPGINPEENLLLINFLKEVARVAEED